MGGREEVLVQLLTKGGLVVKRGLIWGMFYNLDTLKRGKRVGQRKEDV